MSLCEKYLGRKVSSVEELVTGWNMLRDKRKLNGKWEIGGNTVRGIFGECGCPLIRSEWRSNARSAGATTCANFWYRCSKEIQHMLSEEGRRIRLWLSQNAKKTFSTPSIDEARANLEAIADRKPLPAGTRIEPTTTISVPCEWVGASGAAADKVILFLHGGGYTIGTGKACRSLVSLISAASGCRVLVAEFRQAPEHPFPAAVEDATAVYRWVLGQGISPKRIVIAGESAGGGLALAALVALRDAKVKIG